MISGFSSRAVWSVLVAKWYHVKVLDAKNGLELQKQETCSTKQLSLKCAEKREMDCS